MSTLPNNNTPIPDWASESRDHIHDGQYNFEYVKWPARQFSQIPIPGYIENKKYPFTHVNSLTHGSNSYSGMDGPNELQANLKVMPPDWKYRTKRIKYIVNSSGYRTKEWDEIDWTNSIVLLGCSCTFGVGLAEDETISHYIQERTGKYVVNLGVPSGSNELIVNNCAALIKNFPMPYGVVINWSTTDRFRYYSPNSYSDLGPWTGNSKPGITQDNGYVDLKDYWEKTFVDPGNELAKNYYWASYTDAMFQGRTKYSKISFFGLTAHYTRSDKFFTIDNKARDCVHPGEGNSIEIADFIYNKFKE